MSGKQANAEAAWALRQRKARRLRRLLVLACLLYGLGIALPMITVSKFAVIEHSLSLLSGLIELLHNGQVLLFLLISGFSLVLPLLKLHVLFRMLSGNPGPGRRTQRYLHLIHEYGRWAMLDVLVVALLVMAVKLGAIASVTLHAGFYLFAGAVIMIMLVTNRVVALHSESQAAEPVL